MTLYVYSFIIFYIYIYFLIFFLTLDGWVTVYGDFFDFGLQPKT